MDVETEGSVSSHSKGKAAACKIIKRGRTVMKKIIRRRNLGIKTQVKWNRNGQPIEEEAHLLIGFIGVVARKNIPITTKDWRYVPQKTCDSVWLEILVSLEATHTYNFSLSCLFLLTSLL